MSMTDENMRHRFAFKGCFERVEMGLIHRAWINHSHLAMTDNVNTSADKGKRAGIIGNDAADQRANLIYAAIFKVDISNKRDWRGHGNRNRL